MRGKQTNVSHLGAKLPDMTRRDKVPPIILNFSKKCCFLQHFQKSITSLLLVKNGHLRYVKTFPDAREHVFEKKIFFRTLWKAVGAKTCCPQKTTTKMWDYFRRSGQALKYLQKKKLFFSKTPLVDLKRSWSFFFITTFGSLKSAILFWKQQNICGVFFVVFFKACGFG